MEDRPRVVHLVPSLFGPDGVVGGAERYSFELARHMAEQVPTTLVSFGERAAEERHGPLRIRVVAGDPWQRTRWTWPLPRALLAEVLRADVIHCHQQHVLTHSLAALLGRTVRKRVYASDLGGGGLDISAVVSTDRWFRRHLHISEFSRRVYGHLGQPWAHVILGGVDVERFKPDPRVVRDNTVLFVGRLLPHKGVNYLVEAVPPETRLEVIGKPYHPAFADELARLAEGKSVTFRHDCDDVALIRAYRQALCVVLPSVYRTVYGGESTVPELLGQTLLEGMACGAPCICTDVASMPEIVLDGVTGFVVPPNDSEALGQRVKWLLDHPADAQRMGEAARRRVSERFTWPAVVRRCLEIYALDR